MDRRLPGSGVDMQWRIALDGMPDIPPAARLQLMRVVQEALTNALRHARASVIQVGASYEPLGHRLDIWIEDNGRGFDAENPRPGGRGLRNQQHRCAQIGAVLLIDSSAQGTRVSLAWNLPSGRERSQGLQGT